MYCPKCQNQTEDGAQFCRNCGTSLRYAPEQKQDNDASSIMLLVYILILFINTLFQFVITEVSEFQMETFKYVLGLMWIISNISLFLPALAIKNKPLKIVGIIFASIWIIYHVIQNIQWMLAFNRY